MSDTDIDEITLNCKNIGLDKYYLFIEDCKKQVAKENITDN